MNIQKEFKILVLPVLRGLPLLVTILVLAYFLSAYAIRYMVPVYETEATIKLDNRAHQSDGYSLLNDQNNSISGSNFLTELELFKSTALQKTALKKLPFDITYHRIGKVKTIELFQDNPFIIDYKILDSVILDQAFYLTYKGNGRFRIFKDKNFTDYLRTIKVNRSYTDSTTLSYRVRLNEKVIKERTGSLKEGDRFAFTINSLETLAMNINSNNFFVRPVDKDVFVVKLLYKHEVPKKSALFLNKLIDAYIETDQFNKAVKASKTLAFIDKEIEKVKNNLKDSERKKANFRKKYGIVNPLQETEAILRQLNEYDINKMTLDLQEVELQNVNDYLTEDRQVSGFSPDFETIKDEVFQNTFIDLKRYESEKTDLLKKYPETSLEAQTLNKKISDLKTFVLESVEKKLSNVKDKRFEIQGTIQSLQDHFNSYPEKERKLATLQRNQLLNEETFQFLTKKRTEIGISHSSDLPLHQVVDYAHEPIEPISPNKALIIGVSLFIALLFGLALIYLLNYFFAGVQSVSDIEEELNIPFLGTVKKSKKSGDSSLESILNLYTNIENLPFFDGPKMITVASLSKGEGKTFITENLGRLLAGYGKRVLLIDMNFHSPKLKKIFSLNPDTKGKLKEIPTQQINKIGNENLDFVFLAGEDNQMTSTLLFAPQTATFLNEMKSNYDVVLIDTSATSKKIDAAAAMRISDLNLFVFKKGKSKLRKLGDCQSFIDAYNLENVKFVLNT